MDRCEPAKTTKPRNDVVTLPATTTEPTLEQALDYLLAQARRHDRQWVQPLRRIQQLIGCGRHEDAHARWMRLLQPVRGSLHEFFVYCADLDQMRKLNEDIDAARQRIGLLLTEAVAQAQPALAAIDGD